MRKTISFPDRPGAAKKPAGQAGGLPPFRGLRLWVAEVTAMPPAVHLRRGRGNPPGRRVQAGGGGGADTGGPPRQRPRRAAHRAPAVHPEKRGVDTRHPARWASPAANEGARRAHPSEGQNRNRSASAAPAPRPRRAPPGAEPARRRPPPARSHGKPCDPGRTRGPRRRWGQLVARGPRSPRLPGARRRDRAARSCGRSARQAVTSPGGQHHRIPANPLHSITLHLIALQLDERNAMR